MALHRVLSTSEGKQACKHPLSSSTNAKGRALPTGSQIPEFGFSRGCLSLASDRQVMALTALLICFGEGLSTATKFRHSCEKLRELKRKYQPENASKGFK